MALSLSAIVPHLKLVSIIHPGHTHLAGIKCNAPANSRLLRFPGSISSVHQMFVTQQGALHFMCFSNAIVLIIHQR
jgi:hypothetical protein